MQSSVANILLLVVFIGMIYFMMIRPQRKKDKEDREMRSSLKVGDEIITIGGVVGKVTKITEKTVTVETGSGRNKIEFLKTAIASVSKTDTAKGETKKEAEKEEALEDEKRPDRDKKVTPKKLTRKSEGDEEAPVENKPEEPAPAPVAEAAAAATVASSVADFASETAKEDLSPDQKAFEAFKSSTKQNKPQKDKLEGVQTYGKVSSGVDAFGKSTNAASVEQRAPVKRQANNVRPGAGKQDAAPSAVKRPPRQSTSNSTPFGSANERRIPPTQRKSAACQTGNIQPVTTVETKKKKSFGVGSIIAAVVLFLIR